MRRPDFLSNKRVTCDFCGLDFVGNISKANLFMCDRCVRYLCSASEGKKIKFLERFKGEKEKEKVIKRFISEEVLEDGEQTKNNTGHNSRVASNGKHSWYQKNQVWKMQGSFVLDKGRA